MMVMLEYQDSDQDEVLCRPAAEIVAIARLQAKAAFLCLPLAKQAWSQYLAPSILPHAMTSQNLFPVPLVQTLHKTSQYRQERVRAVAKWLHNIPKQQSTVNS